MADLEYRQIRWTGVSFMKLCIVTHKVLKGEGQGRVNYEVACEAVRRG